jgi:hypothetical protein
MLQNIVDLKISSAYLFLARVTSKRGREVLVTPPPFKSGTFGSHLFYTDYVVVYFLEGHSDIICKCIARQMPDNGFNQFICLCVKCKEVEIFLNE